jgi:heat-inducible transcriptional repressor
MVLSKDELRARKDQILGITVTHYIKTVNPVSSSFIATSSLLDLSSATIRNILSELEEDGLLTHPHTSAGRIPTEQGYRYYVDHLLNEINVLEEEKTRINIEYHQQRLELATLLDQISRALSDMTHYTTIVSVDGYNKLICTGTSYVASHPDYQDLKKVHHILSALEEKERLIHVINRELENKVNVYIGQEIALNEMEDCSLVISKYQTKSGPSGRLALLGPTRMEYERVISLLDYAQRVIGQLEV